MVVFPNCKINLGLNIIARRSDGFHDLETVFYPIPLYDILEVIATEETYGHDLRLSTGGLPVEGNKEDNLCIKAWQLIRNDHLHLPGISMYLYKNIPMGAGLGGGSADAAFTLKLLDRLFDLHISDEQLRRYCLALGSDCTFFLLNQPCFASGRGEILEPVTPDLSLYKIVLVNPGIHVHTGNAFAQATPSVPTIPIKELIQLPLTEWKDKLKNDFEIPVFTQYPQLKKIKDELYAAGATYASMSGSGSTVYGIFEKESSVALKLPEHYRLYSFHDK